MPIGGNITGGGSTSYWALEYEVDFSAEATSASLNSDDTISIQGKTWTAKNGADSVYCDDLKIINGTGLQVQFGTGNTGSQQSQNVHTCPRIEILISSLVSGLAYSDTIAIQLQTSSGGLSQDWQTYGITVSDNGAATTKWMCNRLLYYSGFTTYDIGNDVELGDTSRYSLARPGVAAEPPFREIVWNVGGSAFALGADAASGWRDPLTSSQMQIFGTINYSAAIVPSATPALDITTGNATLQITATYDDQGAPEPAWNATFTKLRVLRRKI
jgi:hypothetical protein